jgi:hypothetical protein
LDSGISGKAGAGWSLPKDLTGDQYTDWLVEFMMRGLASGSDEQRRNQVLKFVEATFISGPSKPGSLLARDAPDIGPAAKYRWQTFRLTRGRSRSYFDAAAQITHLFWL